MTLGFILKDSNYKLSQFTPAEITDLEQSLFLKQTKQGQGYYVNCLVRNKEIQLKPEEVIRQLYLRVLNGRYGYPFSRMEVEYSVSFGREKKKADLVIFDQDRPEVPYIIIELKKPKLKEGKDQLKSYCNATGDPMAIWTNGEQISYYQRKDPNYFEDITDIPNVNQTLADILNEKFTLEDLIKKDKLVTEKKSLKELIEDLEDEVLANAGVDVFEEVFKLIFTKLYDEWLSGQGNNKNSRLLEFRNTGQTETALKNKIQNLFDQAKKKWEGVFSEDSKIILTPSHLSVCVSSLENVKLFNSNLDVVDEAFEYLINKSSKGEKGQFFTPRYVIDMCVKMLNPKEDEFMIDTAAGSAGFPVHTIFHVWKQILVDEGLSTTHLFSLENKPYRCRQYVENQVFAIDFDEKAVRVARTLNLIAGDGETNVLHLNTLDFERWDEWTKDEQWNDIYNNGFKRLKKLQKVKGNYQQFEFDLLMANPPFAGDIKESRLIQKYDLSVKDNGKRQTKMGRDILFIERNLDFLKPGGRMAIILPQGRFNNSSDKYIRDYLAERCRILAVIGLHGNTFKPHTGTKTSVLLVQKWDDQLCPKIDDYQIFFATMRKSGKDNSGEKIYLKDSNNNPILDDHGHLIVDHDLFNHDGKTDDGIAEAFIEFAKKEGLSFFDLSLSINAFDSVKYQALMDRLEAVELKLSQVLEHNQYFRFDSEFFKKKYFSIEAKLRLIPNTI
jgi:type I restriction enzyme M protein